MISKPDNLILEEIFGGMGSVEPMEEILRSTALATDGDGAQNPSHGEEIPQTVKSTSQGWECKLPSCAMGATILKWRNFQQTQIFSPVNFYFSHRHAT